MQRTLLASHAQRQIKKVTVAGITGAIGPPIAQALVRAGFTVQALTREAKQCSPGPIYHRSVDYTHLRGLRSLLEGQDAVISCLGDTPACMKAQEGLIQASLDVGVKRFVPSEFGSDTTNAYVKHLPFFYEKVRHQNMLREAAAKHKDFSYSVLITGLFLDWCLSTVPCIINVGSGTSQIFDDGNTPFSTTRTPTVASAVTSLLLQPERSHNRVYRIHELVITQNELLQRSKNILKSDYEPKLKHIETARYEQEAWRAYVRKTGDPLDWIVPFINLSVWSRSSPGHFKQIDNDTLGVPALTGHARLAVVDAELSQAASQFGHPSKMCYTGVKTALADRAYEEGKAKLVDRSTYWPSDPKSDQVHATF